MPPDNYVKFAYGWICSGYTTIISIMCPPLTRVDFLARLLIVTPEAISRAPALAGKPWRRLPVSLGRVLTSSTHWCRLSPAAVSEISNSTPLPLCDYAPPSPVPPTTRRGLRSDTGYRAASLLESAIRNNVVNSFLQVFRFASTTGGGLLRKPMNQPLNGVTEIPYAHARKLWS